jgi:hypothetical protein
LVELVVQQWTLLLVSQKLENSNSYAIAAALIEELVSLHYSLLN